MTDAEWHWLTALIATPPTSWDVVLLLLGVGVALCMLASLHPALRCCLASYLSGLIVLLYGFFRAWALIRPTAQAMPWLGWLYWLVVFGVITWITIEIIGQIEGHRTRGDV